MLTRGLEANGYFVDAVDNGAEATLGQSPFRFRDISSIAPGPIRYRIGYKRRLCYTCAS